MWYERFFLQKLDNILLKLLTHISLEPTDKGQAFLSRSYGILIFSSLKSMSAKTRYAKIEPGESVTAL